MDLPSSISRLHDRYHLTYQVALILSCGSMIGSAVFFPLDAIGNHGFCDILIAIFVVSATVWHILELEALIEYWVYTIPPGLVILLLAVVFAGPSRADVAAWLPFSIVTLSLTTVAIRDIRRRHRPGNVTPDGHADDTSPRLYMAHQSIIRFLKEPGPVYIRQPSTPQATLTERSTLTLSSTPARARPSWGHRVLGFFVDPAAFWNNQLPSRRSSQTSLEGSCGRDAAPNLPGGGEDLPPDAELGMYSPLLGLDHLREASTDY